MHEIARRIRGPNVKTFIRSSNGASAFESFKKATEEKRVILSTARISELFADSDAWKCIRLSIPCRSGTIVAYVEPDTAFNKSAMFNPEHNTIEYADGKTGERWAFPVGKHGEAANAILVAEYPDYSLKVHGNEISVLAKPESIDMIELPTKDGWYFPDPKHDLPTGEQISGYDISRIRFDGLDARHLSRSEGAGKVTHVVRSYDHMFGNQTYWRHVFLDENPSTRLGAAAEAPPGKMTPDPELLTIDCAERRLIVWGVPRLLKKAAELLERIKPGPKPLRTKLEENRIIFWGPQQQLEHAAKLFEKLNGRQ